MGNDHTQRTSYFAKKLGKVEILPREYEGEMVLTVTTTFDAASWTHDSHSYEVTLGFREAEIVLDCPGFNIDSTYEARLNKDFWSEADTLTNSSSQKGFLGFGFKFRSPFTTVKAGANIGVESNQSYTATTFNTYGLITATVLGWRIGGFLGDPRNSKATCGPKYNLLNGRYFSGNNGEESSAKRIKSNDQPVAAVLAPKAGANDNNISARLYGVKDSLEVRVEHKNPYQAGETVEETISGIKQALIRICIAKELDERGEREEEKYLLLNTDSKKVPNAAPKKVST